MQCKQASELEAVLGCKQAKQAAREAIGKIHANIPFTNPYR